MDDWTQMEIEFWGEWMFGYSMSCMNVWTQLETGFWGIDVCILLNMGFKLHGCLDSVISYCWIRVWSCMDVWIQLFGNCFWDAHAGVWIYSWKIVKNRGCLYKVGKWFVRCMYAWIQLETGFWAVWIFGYSWNHYSYEELENDKEKQKNQWLQCNFASKITKKNKP